VLKVLLRGLLLLTGFSYSALEASPYPACLNVTAVVTPESCPNNADGAIDLSVNGGQPPYTYLWSTGDGLPNLNGLSQGTYIVTITDSLGCEVVDSFSVGLLGPAPVAQAGADQVVCASPAQLAANVLTSGSGQWQVVAGSGTFADTTSASTLVAGLSPGANLLAWVVSQGNCADADTIEVYASHAGFVDAGPDLVVCQGSTTLSGSSPGPGFGNWSAPTGVAVSDSTDPNSGIVLPAPGSYQLSWTVQESGCTGQDQLTLTWPVPVESDFSVATNQLQANFTDLSQGGHTVTWSFGDGSFSSQSNPSHTYTQPGTYTVCQTIEDSCTVDSTCQVITITCPAPSPAFTYTASGPFVDFTDLSSSNAGISAWEWDFDDGTTSNLQNPTHLFLSPGPFNVCLRVFDVCGDGVDCQLISFAVVGTDLAADAQIQLYPQPATDRVALEVNGWQDEDVEIRVYDGLGQEMMRENAAVQSGQTQLNWSVADWARGIYRVEISGASHREWRTLVRQ